MRVLFVGGHGHHYLAQGVERGLVEAVGMAGDGIDDAAAKGMCERRWGGKVRYFEDVEAAVRESGCEAVSVGSWYGRNGQVIERVMKAGVKRVVSDKPIAGTWEQMRMLEERVEGDVRLLTEFDLRCKAGFRAAREVVKRGWIGEVVLATGQKSYRFGESRPEFYKRREDYGGTLMWVGSHGLDVVWFVTGMEPVRVTGHGGNVSKEQWGEMEDHVMVNWVLRGGGSAVVHADYLRPAGAETHGDDRLRVAGSEGVVEVREGRCVLITATRGAHDVTELGEGADTVKELLSGLNGQASVFGTEQSMTMARWLLRSRDAVDEGKWLEM